MEFNSGFKGLILSRFVTLHNIIPLRDTS